MACERLLQHADRIDLATERAECEKYLKEELPKQMEENAF
jgi:hypothetical protein